MSYNDVICRNGQRWVVPAPGLFNTAHDCTLFARYLSLMLRYDSQFGSVDQLDHYDHLAHQEHKLCRVPIIATENYIADSLPPELRPSSCELIEWYYGNHSFCEEAPYIPNPEAPSMWDPYVHKLIYEPRLACNKELRSALGLAGNPDIAGIGVMISYCVEVVLVTICLALFAAERLERRYPNGRLQTFLSAPITARLLNAFKGSVQALFSSAMIFSFAMVLATLSTFSYRLDRSEVEQRWMNGEEVSLYEPQLLVTASTFSLFPVIVLHFAMHSGTSGMRRQMKTVLLLVLYGLCSASILWLCSSYFQPDWQITFWFDTEPDILLSDFVYNRYDAYAGTLFALIVAIPAVGGIIALLLMAWYRRTRRPAQVDWWALPPCFLLVCRIVIPLCCFLMMWISTFLLFFLRDEAIKDSGTDSTTEWTVGQILALANWGPVIVEFIYLSCFGSATGKDENHDEEDCIPKSTDLRGQTRIIVPPSRRDTQDTFDSSYNKEDKDYESNVVTSPIWQWHTTLCSL
ncbi:hypothetical protein AB5N19_01923 [Seiridium cardinale]